MHAYYLYSLTLPHTIRIHPTYTHTHSHTPHDITLNPLSWLNISTGRYGLSMVWFCIGSSFNPSDEFLCSIDGNIASYDPYYPSAGEIWGIMGVIQGINSVCRWIYPSTRAVMGVPCVYFEGDKICFTCYVWGLGRLWCMNPQIICN